MGIGKLADHRPSEETADGEARLRLKLAAARMGIWEWEIATERVYWSPECFTLLDISPADFGGTRDDFARLLHPDDAPLVWARVEEALTGGAPLLDTLNSACGLRIALMTIPPAIAVGLGHLVTRRPRAPGMQLTTYTLLLLPLLCAFAFIVGAIKEGVEF